MVTVARFSNNNHVRLGRGPSYSRLDPLLVNLAQRSRAAVILEITMVVQKGREHEQLVRTGCRFPGEAERAYQSQNLIAAGEGAKPRPSRR